MTGPIFFIFSTDCGLDGFVTRFAEGATKKSNMQLVTLLEQPEHDYVPGDVNHDGDLTIKEVPIVFVMSLR